MAQKIKCTITEERLARLVSESIEEVLLEAQNDEGLGGFLGKLAGKVRNGVNKFRDDFNAQRNGQLYQNRDYDGYTANGVDPNARNFDKTMSQNYRSALQKGASAAAPGSFTTPYGDSVGGGRENGGNGGSRGNGGNNDVLQQMQQMLAALTQQMQSLMQNGGSTGGAQGSTGGAQGATGGAQGSTEGAQGSTGGAQGSTGGAQGSTGGAQGSTGGAQGKQSLDQDAIRKAHGKAAGQNRVITPKPAPTPESPEQKAAADKVDQTGDWNAAYLGEKRKAQLSGRALMEIISRTIKKHLNENLNEISPEKMAAVAHGRKQQALGQRPLSPAMQRRGMTPQDMAGLEQSDRLQAVDNWNQQYGTGKDPKSFGGWHTKMNSDYTIDTTKYDHDTDTPDGQYNTKGWRYDPSDDTEQDRDSEYTTDLSGKEVRKNGNGDLNKFGGTRTGSNGSTVMQYPNLDRSGKATGMRVYTQGKKTQRTADKPGYASARRMANPGTK